MKSLPSVLLFPFFRSLTMKFTEELLQLAEWSKQIMALGFDSDKRIFSRDEAKTTGAGLEDMNF